MPAKGDWFLYEAPDGQFTAVFPKEPEYWVENVDGVEINFLIFRTGGDTWEISWTELDHNDGFSMMGALNGVPTETGGKFTEARRQDHAGLPGMYAEIDDGRVKVQMFRSVERVWTVAASEHCDDFEFFLKNVRLSDEARGIQPLKLEFNEPATAFANRDVYLGGFTVTGGRAPYKWTLNGDLPPGTRQEKMDVDDVPWEKYTFSGNAGPVSQYPISMTVTDADGRRARTSGLIEVQDFPDEIGELSVETRVLEYPHYAEREAPKTSGATVLVTSGLSVVGSVELKKTSKELPASVSNFNWTGVPDWLEVRKVGSGISFGGKPVIPGVYQFTVTAVGRVAGFDREYELSCLIEINVQAMAKDDLPSDFGVLSVEDIDTRVATREHVECTFETPTPQDWNPSRRWGVKIEWAPDLQALNAMLPKGMHASIQDAEIRQGYRTDHSRLIIFGIPEVPAELEIEIKVIARVPYVEEPYEFVDTFSIRVEPLRANQVPEALRVERDWRINGIHDFALSGSLKFEAHKPSTWADRMWFDYSYEWLVDDMEPPSGVTLEVDEHWSEERPQLMVKGMISKPGVYEFDAKLRVRIKGIDKVYEVKGKVELTIR